MKSELDHIDLYKNLDIFRPNQVNIVHVFVISGKRAKYRQHRTRNER